MQFQEPAGKSEARNPKVGIIHVPATDPPDTAALREMRIAPDIDMLVGVFYGFANMNALVSSLVELIRRTSAEIPDDVQTAIVQSLENEKKGSIAESALKII